MKLQKVNESGRSMVEMLGVLAIVGVLSVMGIAGYTIAMSSHHANEVLNQVNRVAMLISAERQLHGGVGSPTSDDNPYEVSLDINNTNKIVLTASNVPAGALEKLKDMNLSAPKINVSGNDVTFTFNNDLSGEDAGTGTQDNVVRCEGGRIKCGDACCGENEICAATQAMVMPGDESYGCREASQLACQTNASCGAGEYCKISGGMRCDVVSSAECASTSPFELTEVSLNGKTFYASLVRMTSWWSAENFCLANGKKLASLASLGLSKSYTGECLSWTCYVNGTDTENCVANELGSYTCTGMTGEECYLDGGEYNCTATVANKADCAGSVEDECNQKGNGPLYQAFSAAGVADIQYWVADRNGSCNSYRIFASSDHEWASGEGLRGLLLASENYALCE